MDGGGKYPWGRPAEEEVECVAGGNLEFCWARLGLRHVLGTQFSTSAGTTSV